MKYSIISDIHGNQEAFDAVLEDARRQGAEHFVFLGDIVGYGAEPGACIARLRELIRSPGCICVAGNHDYAVSGKSPRDQYNTYARESVEWTKKQLTSEECGFLDRLPLTERIPLAQGRPSGSPGRGTASGGRPAPDTGGFRAVHANLVAPGEWGYILDIDDAHPNFLLLEEQVCFIGHSHKPLIFLEGDFIDWFQEDSFRLEPGVRYIINAGSVGQPRDGNPRASYAIFDDSALTVDIRRVEYDIPRAQQKIIKAGLPRMLADRLSIGK
ncbi:MAG: metallophosphoesterase family protein [Candidatus Omnitrophota bacterium]|nr:metallophosphoesterase family protein [Candidatus Omnitrophota bacterium]MDZ4241936.1 metallophosphoesterase family protein [Candidatus Omnitrophota bacterium]